MKVEQYNKKLFVEKDVVFQNDSFKIFTIDDSDSSDGRNSVAEMRVDTSTKKKECKELQLSSVDEEHRANILNLIVSVTGSIPVVGVVPATIFGHFTENAYDRKQALDGFYIEMECDDIPFDEMKDILGDRFDQLDIAIDRNYATVRENLEAIQRNYLAIKQVEDKVDKNLVAIQSGFITMAHQFGRTRDELKEGFEKIRTFVRQSKIEEVTSGLITFIEYFTVEKKALKYLSPNALIAKLEGESGTLNYLKKSGTPQSITSLHVLLNDIINRRLAIPESASDETAFTALYLLCLGIDTYISVLFFLLNGYNYLAEDNYQKRNIEAYNGYFFESLNTFNDFSYSLRGIDGKGGLINKVIDDVLDKIKKLDFIKNGKSNIVEFISEKRDKLSLIKSHLLPVTDSPNNKAGERIRCQFTHSTIRTPFIGWQNGRKVSYAVQYMNNGIYFPVSDWSLPYTIYGKACPKLDIGAAPRRMTRLIFRRFDDDKPELVGIVEDSYQIEFRDIHRDLYNAALETNEEIAKLDINALINDGANVTATFEKGKQAIHAAAQSGNLGSILALVNKGADINAQDENGYSPLHIAAQLGFENFITDLLSHGADINVTSRSNWTALHVAAEKGYISTIESLLQAEGVDINARADGGFTPMHVAVSSNENIDVVFTLSSDERINLNTQSEKGLTPLHLAVLGGYEHATEALLTRNKTDVSLEAHGNLTALHLASTTGNVKIVTQLLGHNETDINASSEDGWTPLHFAISLKKESVTQILLNSTNIDVNAEGKDKITPLHLASSAGQNDILSELLDKGAQIKVREKNGYTALHFAAKEGNFDTVKLLIEKGADFNAKNKWGDTPLNLALSSRHSDVIQYLIDKELVEYDIHNLNNTSFHYAADKGSLEIVKYLIDTKQMHFNVQNNRGETPLHFAVLGGNFEVVKCFIGVKQVNVNLQNNRGETPLHLAVLGGNFEIVKCFIGVKEVNVNLQNNRGETPLHLAAIEGHLDTVKLLVEKGADFKMKNKWGKTPLRLAMSSEYPDIAQYLIVKELNWLSTDPDNNIPLHLAARVGRLDIVKYLMDAEDEYIYSLNRRRETPLHLAVLGGHLEVIKYILKKKSFYAYFRNNVSYSQETPSHYAVKGGRAEVVKCLLDKEPESFAVTNSYGDTPLNLAAKRGFFEAVKYIVEASEETLIFMDKNYMSYSPLNSAVENGHLEIVKYLMDKIDKAWYFNLKTGFGSSNLHCASKGCSLEVIKYLIDTQRMNPNVRDREGNTPLHIAALHGCLPIVKYLIDDKKVNFRVRNNQGENPLQMAAINSSSTRLGVIKYLESKGASRSRRSLEAIGTIESSEEEKEQVLSAATGNKNLFEHNEKTQSSKNEDEQFPQGRKKREKVLYKNEKNLELKNWEGTTNSYTYLFKSGIKQTAPMLVSEMGLKGGGVKIASRIEGQGKAREHSKWPIRYEASYENVPFIKWVGYLMSRRSFVERMNQAEQSSSSHERVNQNSGLSEELYWTEKLLKEGIGRYGKK